MDAQRMALQEEKRRLLERLAEIEIEQQREAGMFKSVPHYSFLEQAARIHLGQTLFFVFVDNDEENEKQCLTPTA